MLYLCATTDKESLKVFLKRSFNRCFLFGLDSGVSWEAGPAQKDRGLWPLQAHQS